MSFREITEQINPRFLMGLWVGGQAVSQMAQRALEDGKLTVGEALEILRTATQATGLHDKVVWKQKSK